VKAHCPKCGKFVTWSWSGISNVVKRGFLWKRKYQQTPHKFHCNNCDYGFIEVFEERLR